MEAAFKREREGDEMIIDDKKKELLAKLELENEPVALKYVYAQPVGIDRYKGTGAFCELVAAAAQAPAPFYTDKDNDTCVGKVALGMVEPNGFAASGVTGPDIDMFGTEAPNSRIYEQMVRLQRGAHNYVIMAPISQCDFEPDIIVMVAPTEKAEIILRATNWVSGDPWESKSMQVISCGWMYAYTYATGKVNFCITGMHHGLKRRNLYAPGQHLISIPFQKMPEFFYSLEHMNWVGLFFRQDTEEARQELAEKQAKWTNGGAPVLK